MKIKTLLERLKPEFKKALDEHEVEYPHTVKDIKQELSTHYGVTFVRYGIVTELDSIAYHYKIPFEIKKPWDAFEEVEL
jgi:hypothetical protein